MPASANVTKRSANGPLQQRPPLLRPLAALLLVLYVPVVLVLTWTAAPEVASAQDNLVPFATIRAVWNDTAPAGVFTQAVGNILLFLPVGLLARRALPRLGALTLVVAVALAAGAVEYYQGKYVAGRIVDVDDAILGAIGGFLGVLMGGWRRARR
jgi:glycopeptide antibiotics resistance protein